MNDHLRGILADWDADADDIAEAMGYAIADALREHKAKGVPIAVWDEDNNCVVLVPPEEIVIPGESAETPVELARESS